MQAGWSGSTAGDVGPVAGPTAGFIYLMGPSDRPSCPAYDHLSRSYGARSVNPQADDTEYAAQSWCGQLTRTECAPNCIKLTDLTRSTVFMEGDEGLKHRTAWAGAGDGVLFYDTETVGQAGYDEISDIREYVFTEWGARRSRNGPGDRFRQRTRKAPGTVKDDLAALRSRFYSNGDRRLTGADLNGRIKQSIKERGLKIE